MPKTRNNKDNKLAERILSAARQLFLEQGYHKTSMRKLAGMIGYSPTTIYLYFKNKNDIFLRLTDDVSREILRLFKARDQRGGDPRERLKSMFDAYVDYGLANPGDYRLGFMLKADAWPKPEAHFPEGSNALKLYRFMLSKVSAFLGGEAQGLDPVDLEARAQAAWTALHGLVSLVHTYPSFPWARVEELKKRAVQSALAAII